MDPSAVTQDDIVENPHNIEFLEIAAEQVPRTLQDVDFAVANGNYAVEAGILDKVLVTEDASSEGAQTYPNVIAVREGDEDREDIQALVAALKSEETRAFIEETYGDLTEYLTTYIEAAVRRQKLSTSTAAAALESASSTTVAASTAAATAAAVVQNAVQKISSEAAPA